MTSIHQTSNESIHAMVRIASKQAWDHWIDNAEPLYLFYLPQGELLKFVPDNPDDSLKAKDHGLVLADPQAYRANLTREQLTRRVYASIGGLPILHPC